MVDMYPHEALHPYVHQMMMYPAEIDESEEETAITGILPVLVREARGEEGDPNHHHPPKGDHHHPHTGDGHLHPGIDVSRPDHTDQARGKVPPTGKREAIL